MTSPDYGELVKRLRSRCENVYDYATQGAEWQQDALCVQAADALEQQSREIAACEGALRNSGNMVRDLNDLAKRYENELTRHKHVTHTLMVAWPKGVPMPEWEEPAENERTKAT